MTYNEVLKEAKEINERLLATDFGNTSVQIIHEEGTYMFFKNAFIMTYDKEDWIMIFTEHHGFFVYHEDDVKVIEYKENRF